MSINQQVVMNSVLVPRSVAEGSIDHGPCELIWAHYGLMWVSLVLAFVQPAIKSAAACNLS